MATWPSGTKASTTNLDADTDSPASARADIKQNTDNVNSIIDMFNIATPSNNQILKYNTSNTRFELASDDVASYTLAGDTGTSQTISNGNTLTIAGGTNLNSVASATDTVTLNLDTTVTGLTSLTSTTLITETIQSAGNSPITIAPDGTGDVHLNTDSVRIGDNNADATLATRGTGDLILTTNEGSGTEGVVRIYDGANGNITLTPNGTGNLVLDGLNWPQADGTANYVLKTNGSAQLSWVAQPSAFDTASPGAIGGTTASTGTFTTLTVNAANDLRLADTDSSNYVGFKAPATVTTNKIWTLPSADGTAGQVLSTNGSATLSWATAGGGGGASVAIINQDAIKGTLITGSTYRQSLSEESDPSGIITVTSNQFTVGAGTYIIEFAGVNKCTTVGAVFQHQLYDVTGSTAIDNIPGGLVNDGTNTTRWVFQWSYVVAPSSSNTYEIRTLLDATSNAVGIIGATPRFRIIKLA